MSVQPKSLIPEVSILRPITIVLLVLMHSFTVFDNSWRPFDGYIDIEAYKWITRVSFSCMLEMFVFLSGYVLAYQIINLGRSYKWIDFVKRKFQRLIIPSVVFSVIYILILQYNQLTIKNLMGGGILLSLLEGVGHLWFLPMLFWCFVAGYPLMKTKMNDTVVLFGLLCLSVVSWIVPLPLRMGSSCYYLFFFYLGYYIYKRKDKVADMRGYTLAIISLLYITTFLITQTYINGVTITHDSPLWMKAIVPSVKKIGLISYSLLGILTFYTLTIKMQKKQNDRHLSSFVLYANSICFGVYIYQQFILQILYYHTSFPQIAGPYLLPWLGFIIALTLSVLLAHLTIKTKIGKSLIG